MTHEQHCIECITKLGEPFPEVHQWLDQFCHDPKYQTRHRRVRHHTAGIEEIRAKWGDRAAEAAKLHILADLRLDGWTEADPFPKDEAQYVKMGLW
jgi:hypothetical protein